MAIFVVSAPSALAQQGGGLCAGAQEVDSFSNTSGNIAIIIPTDAFPIDTATFQVAVETEKTEPGDAGSVTSVTVDDDDDSVAVASQEFRAGEDGVITVENNGNGPFSLLLDTQQQTFDITVYECPNGTPGGGGEVPEGPDDGANDNTDDETTNGTGDDTANNDTGGNTGGSGDNANNNDDQQIGDDQYPLEDNNNGSTPGGDQYPPEGEDDPDDTGSMIGNGGAGTGTGSGAGNEGSGTETAEGGDPNEGGIVEEDDTDGGGVVPILPDTGGASLFTLGVGALLVAGGLLARRILR